MQGNSNNLHRIIVDDFTDSMTYLLMVAPRKLIHSIIIITSPSVDTILTLLQASHFNTDVVNRAGFSKLFMGHSDKMWARGKARIACILSFSLKKMLRCSTKLEEISTELQSAICRT